jgi:RNA polymerase sigma-70 factor (ECF subfamily)
VDDHEAQRLRIFDQHRGLLFSIAYRMLGSTADAEDMLQDAYLRWRTAADNDVRSPRAYLVTIVSRLCLNHLQAARTRREEYFGEWLPEPVITSPRDEDVAGAARIDGSLSIAFLVLLERLTPMERAVFLLREIFDYEYSEIAVILGATEANCRQILRRARQHIAEIRPRFEATPGEREKLLQSFVEATRSGDLNGIVALLSHDAVLHSDGGGKAAALPKPVYGAENIARAILGGLEKLVPKNLVGRIMEVNGQPGVVSYLEGRPYSVLTLDVAEGKIRGVYIVTNPEKLTRLVPAAASHPFHLPGVKPPNTGGRLN